MKTFSGYTQGVYKEYPFDTSKHLIVDKRYDFGEEDKIVSTNVSVFVPAKHTTNLKNVTLPTRYTEDFCRFLGYFVANGSYGDNFLSFSTKNTEIGNHYSHLVQELFSTNTVERIYSHKVPNYATSSVVIRNFLIEDIFKGRHTARFKVIPDGVKQSSKSCILSFLVGLLDCDSYIEHGTNFTFNTASESVAKDVHKMLLGFGVVSNLRPFNNVKGYEDHTYWDVKISGKYFYKLMEVLSSKGSLIYERGEIKKKINTNFDFVPNMNLWLLEEIAKIRKDLNVMSNGMYRNSQGKTERFKISSGYVLECRKSMTYEMLHKILTCWENLPENQKPLIDHMKKVIEEIIEDDYYFDKILHEEE